MPAVQRRYGEMEPAPQTYLATIIRQDAATDGWLCHVISIDAVDITAAVAAAKSRLEPDNGEVLWSVMPDRGAKLGGSLQDRLARNRTRQPSCRLATRD